MLQIVAQYCWVRVVLEIVFFNCVKICQHFIGPQSMSWLHFKELLVPHHHCKKDYIDCSRSNKSRMHSTQSVELWLIVKTDFFSRREITRNALVDGLTSTCLNNTLMNTILKWILNILIFMFVVYRCECVWMLCWVLRVWFLLMFLVDGSPCKSVFWSMASALMILWILLYEFMKIWCQLV